jgi:hypothetical protein
MGLKTEELFCCGFVFFFVIPLIALFLNKFGAQGREQAQAHRRAQEDGLISATKAREATGMREIAALIDEAKAEPPIHGTETLRAQLARIKANRDVGSDINTYRAELASLVEAAEQCQSRTARGAPALANLIELAVGHHKQALQRWVEMEGTISSHTTGNWSGGGFGVGGALQGALLAGVLNAIQDNTGKIKRLLLLGEAERQTSWALAFACHTAISEVPAPTDRPQGRCANCDKSMGKLEKCHEWKGHCVCGACHQTLSA